MYFIVNKTKTTVPLTDLGFILGPKKAVDLDKLFDRSKIENSKDLKKSISTGLVQLRSDTNKAKPATPNVSHTIVHQATVGDEQIQKIRETIREEVKSHLTNNPPPQSPDILNAINKLSDIVQSRTQISQSVPSEKVEEIDEKTLTDIHAKHIEKATANLSGNVNYQQKSVKGDVADRAAELTDLLG